MPVLPIIAVFCSPNNWFQLQYTDQSRSSVYRWNSQEALSTVMAMAPSERSAMCYAKFVKPNEWVPVGDV